MRPVESPDPGYNVNQNRKLSADRMPHLLQQALNYAYDS